MDVDTQPATTTARPREYWCHQCALEITPLLVPDPLCPNCHSEFVEKIEADNDPRSFVEHAPGQAEDEEDSQEAIQLEDLLRLFQTIAGPPRSAAPPQRPLNQSNLYSNTAGAPPSFVFGSTSEQNPTQDHAAQDDQEELPSVQSSQQFLASLLERLGLQLHGGEGGGLFNMVGNPGDYVFGQGGLDDVVTQMMELHNRQHGPVGAPDELIESIPRHVLTADELEAKTECSVCKDEFTTEDHCLQLQCKHIFHDDCIKPWLKTNATCPTCRFSLIATAVEENQEGASGATPIVPGAFPTNL